MYFKIKETIEKLIKEKFSGTLTIIMNFHKGGVRKCEKEIKTKVE